MHFSLLSLEVVPGLEWVTPTYSVLAKSGHCVLEAWKIYRSDEEEGRPGWPPPHRCDESSTGYSSAGCSPAVPASASPAGNDLAVERRAVSIEGGRQRCYPWIFWVRSEEN